MMWPTFGAPWILAGAALGALLIGVLHLLSVRQPMVLELPTARFVPEGEARAVARQPRPNDLLLLALRVLAVLLAGLALAGVQWPATRATVLHLVVMDSVVARDSTWRDSLARSLQADRVLVHMVPAPGVAHDPGAALVTATAEAARLVRRFTTLEAVELTVMVPPQAASWRGFDAWRAHWPGAVRVLTREHRAHADTAAVSSGVPSGVRVFASRSATDDPVAAAWSRGAPADASNGAAGARRDVHVWRDAMRDRAATGAPAPAVIVHWPAAGVPDGWDARERADSVGALVAHGAVLPGPWPRVARPGATWQARLDSAPGAHAAWRVVAWWSDGEPAAVEQWDGTTCTRVVAVQVPRGSDLLLSPAARGVRDALTGPCGGPRASWDAVRRSPDSPRANGAAPAAAFRGGAVVPRGSDPRWLAPLLLGLCLATLLAEWLLRRRETSA